MEERGMKVVIAIDSLKGSLSSAEAGNAAKAGVLGAVPDAEVVVKPLADGGEGTTEALIEGMGGESIELQVTGPLGNPVKAFYGWLKEQHLAVLEMASAAGITLLPHGKGDPLHATTRGVGEMIVDALDRGCREFLIGIGGSATNDGGIGMLQALGIQFLDAMGHPVGEGAQALGKIAQVDASGADPRLAACRFRVACDVTNPLCGENGATFVFGPQKGVAAEQKQPLDEAMASYGCVVAEAVGADYAQEPGSGAAGGLGFAFRSFLGAALVPGIELILDAVGLEEELADADYVVTGEGKLDFQTAMGKAPVGVARMAKRHKVPVLAFAGAVTREAKACNAAGIDAFFPIIRGITTLEDAMKKEVAAENMQASVEQVFRALGVCGR